jgi:hypothetical protein
MPPFDLRKKGLRDARRFRRFRQRVSEPVAQRPNLAADRHSVYRGACLVIEWRNHSKTQSRSQNLFDKSKSCFAWLRAFVYLHTEMPGLLRL